MKYRQYYEDYGEDRAELSDDPGNYAVCIECGKWCRPRKVDYGVGRVEVHGVIVNDHDWQWESPCCGAPVED